jgi:hypothetical protein
MRPNTAAMTFRSSRPCGAVSNAELSSIQPLRWRSVNERRGTSPKKRAIASRGGNAAQRQMLWLMLL